AAVPPLLRQLRRALVPGGLLVVKDVDTRPAPKRWFTWALDKAMAPRTPVHYWSAEELSALLEATGFRVRRHLMVDLLPYPHVLDLTGPRAPAGSRRRGEPRRSQSTSRSRGLRTSLGNRCRHLPAKRARAARRWARSSSMDTGAASPVRVPPP